MLLIYLQANKECNELILTEALKKWKENVIIATSCKQTNQCLHDANITAYLSFCADDTINIPENIKQLNNCKSMLLCADKYKTYKMLVKNNIETIFTTLDYNEVSFPAIMKPRFGSKGFATFIVNSIEEIKKYLEQYKGLEFIYQPYISSSYGRHIRIYIVGDEYCGAMLFENKNDFRSNEACGAKLYKTPIEISEKTINDCLKATKAFNLGYCGIDLLFKEDGNLVICELNSAADFGVPGNTIRGIKLEEKILEYFLKKEKNNE